MQFKNPTELFTHMWAFWQHFWIYKRKSDFSWKSIVSIFAEECLYPIMAQRWMDGKFKC